MSARNPSDEDRDTGVKPCQIAEIVQYMCDLENLENGRSQVHCFPIPRIFRMSVLNSHTQTLLLIWMNVPSCSGRPAVEITKFVNINEITGEVEVPPETR